MGWFYVVDEDVDCKCGGYVCGIQGKNSNDDYQEHYMENGEPLVYESIGDLMPKTDGSPENVRLLGSCDTCNKFISLVPVFFNGEWHLKEGE